jgi:hypothetical protein
MAADDCFPFRCFGRGGLTVVPVKTSRGDLPVAPAAPPNDLPTTRAPLTNQPSLILTIIGSGFASTSRRATALRLALRASQNVSKRPG